MDLKVYSELQRSLPHPVRREHNFVDVPSTELLWDLGHMSSVWICYPWWGFSVLFHLLWELHSKPDRHSDWRSGSRIRMECHAPSPCRQTLYSVRTRWQCGLALFPLMVQIVPWGDRLPGMIRIMISVTKNVHRLSLWAIVVLISASRTEVFPIDRSPHCGTKGHSFRVMYHPF